MIKTLENLQEVINNKSRALKCMSSKAIVILIDDKEYNLNDLKYNSELDRFEINAKLN